ncbi:HAD family hydrolase [Demequina rhizosphaerae]|uniref:HAD family hydrolase n=1 Tax=Demequina rhizosphaerae TaxID=1638985 RepID=UPI001E64DA77|nr:beta-phosphoglucomutase family hydrolase [Demequina rhizosphaerae]
MTTDTAPWHLPQVPDASFAAALFDLDGVLTPTADVHMDAWRRMFTDYFEAHGITPAYTDADYFQYVDGKPRYDGVRSCLASRGVTLPEGTPDDAPGTETICGVGNTKNEAFAAILRDEGVTPYPGSVALIEHLESVGCAMAVVSSSRNAPAVLEAAGLADRFEIVVSGQVAADHGIAGKPAPDTYLYAAELLGVPKEQAVVVEDAMSGVEAGRAGAFGLVVGVDRGAGADELLAGGADIVVEDLKELVQA